MVTQTTLGVTISVITQYQAPVFDHPQGEYAFVYRIKIENFSENTLQLLRRHWIISDACGRTTEVEGEGVIGRQPTIEPGEHYEYVSGCVLKSGIGKMRGSYLMERLADGKNVHIAIPEFTMIPDFMMN